MKEKHILVWLSLIDDDTIREKAIRNYNDDDTIREKAIRNYNPEFAIEVQSNVTHTINYAFEWYKTPEGEEYWANIADNCPLRQPIKFPNTVVNTTTQEEWDMVTQYYGYDQKNGFANYCEDTCIRVEGSKGIRFNPSDTYVSETLLSFKEWQEKVGMLVKTTKQPESKFKVGDVINFNGYACNQPDVIPEDGIVASYSTTSDYNNAVIKEILYTNTGYWYLIDETMNYLKECGVFPVKQPTLEVNKWYQQDKALVYITKLSMTGSGNMITGYGFDDAVWIEEDAEWSRTGWKLADELLVIEKLKDYAKNMYNKGAKFISALKRPESTIQPIHAVGGFDYKKQVLWHRCSNGEFVGWLYNKGKWAKVVNEPKESELDTWLRETKALNLSEKELGAYIANGNTCKYSSIYKKLESNKSGDKAKILWNKWNPKATQVVGRMERVIEVGDTVEALVNLYGNKGKHLVIKRINSNGYLLTGNYGYWEHQVKLISKSNSKHKINKDEQKERSGSNSSKESKEKVHKESTNSQTSQANKVVDIRRRPRGKGAKYGLEEGGVTVQSGYVASGNRVERSGTKRRESKSKVSRGSLREGNSVVTS